MKIRVDVMKALILAACEVAGRRPVLIQALGTGFFAQIAANKFLPNSTGDWKLEAARWLGVLAGFALPYIGAGRPVYRAHRFVKAEHTPKD
jgi:hypothetical protein